MRVLQCGHMNGEGDVIGPHTCHGVRLYSAHKLRLLTFSK